MTELHEKCFDTKINAKDLEKELVHLETLVKREKNLRERRRLRRWINESKLELAWVLMDLGEFDRALLLYQSIPWKPYGEEKFNGMARALTEMGYCHKAKRLLETGIKKYPESYALWIALGCLHESQKNYLDALQCLDKALKLSPEDNSTALYDKAYVLAQIGCYQEALEIANQLVYRYPHEPKYLSQKAFLLLSMGYFEQALMSYQEAMKRWQKNQTPSEGICIYSGLCTAYMQLGMKREAMEVALEGLEKFPDEDPVIYHNAGAVFLEMGWRKEAIEVLKKGIEKFPYDGDMRNFLRDIEDDDDSDSGIRVPLLAFLLLVYLLKRKRRE